MPPPGAATWAFAPRSWRLRCCPTCCAPPSGWDDDCLRAAAHARSGLRSRAANHREASPDRREASQVDDADRSPRQAALRRGRLPPIALILFAPAMIASAIAILLEGR